MKTSALAKIVLALALLATAVVCFLKLSPTGDSRSDTTYFYDLGEHQLFVAPRGSIPPIKGIKGTEMAGVRAIVVSTNGNAADKKHRQIAYLEKYSPEVKQVFEEVRRARAEGRSSEVSIDRSQVSANTWVRRLHDADWHALNSAEGKQIANEWNAPGPDGRLPVVCTP